MTSVYPASWLTPAVDNDTIETIKGMCRNNEDVDRTELWLSIRSLCEEVQARREVMDGAVEKDAVRNPLVDTIWQIMYRLADLLDNDKFNNIERIVKDAGVPFPPEGYDGRPHSAVETKAVRSIIDNDTIETIKDGCRTSEKGDRTEYWLSVRLICEELQERRRAGETSVRCTCSPRYQLPEQTCPLHGEHGSVNG